MEILAQRTQILQDNLICLMLSSSSTFKKKAPKAIKGICKFIEAAMGTKDVRVDVKLNK